jgi:Ser/Thr protein kinase RdoA (MazF antagonist)
VRGNRVLPWWEQIRATFIHAPVRPDPKTPPTTWQARNLPIMTSRPRRNGSRPTPLAEPAQGPPPAEPEAPSRDLLERVDQAYDLEGPLGWAPGTKAGSRNLLLQSGERRYMLHVIDAGEGGSLALAAEVELINFLAEHYFPVARVLKTRQEADYLRIDGAFHILTTAEPTQPFQLANSTHRLETAAGLAQFHELMRDYPGPLPLGPSQFLSDVLVDQAGWIETAVRTPATSEAFGRSAVLREALLNARDELNQLASPVAAVYQQEPKILIHGAYDQTAVHFDGLGLADVRNFGQIGYDVRLADLSRSLASFCASPDQAGLGSCGLDPRLLKEFLTIYEQDLPLTPVEAGALPHFMRANHLVKTVDDCRRLLEAAAATGDRRPDFETEAFCLSLQLGRLTRPPPRRDAPRSSPPAP